MNKGTYATPDAFRMNLVSGRAREISTWRSSQAGMEDELIQCLRVNKEYWIRRCFCNVEMVRVFSDYKAANNYFKSLVRYGTYTNIWKEG